MHTPYTLKRIAAISSIIAASVLLTGCNKVAQKVQDKVQDTATTAQTALLSDSDLSGISDPLVRKNFVAQANAKAYKVETTTNGQTKPTSITEIQINGTRMKFHTTMSIAGKTQEMIVIDNTTYVKDSSGSFWWKQNTDPAKNNTQVNSTVKVPSLDDIKQEFKDKQTNTEFKQLGTEACGNLNCYKYQEIDNSDTSHVRTFWFDDQQFLTRKDETKVGASTVTNVYSYDSINIAEPSPTKDVPEGHSAYEYMMGIPTAPSSQSNNGSGNAPSQAEINAMMKAYQAQGSSQGQMPSPTP